MKKYITLIILAAFCIVLDAYALKGLGTELVPTFKREYLYQYFTGSVLDWLGLLLVNVTFILTGVFAAQEKDFYTESPWTVRGIFLGCSIVGLLLIYI